MTLRPHYQENPPKPENQRLSDDFIAIEERLRQGPLSLRQILELMHGRGQALLALFLAFPFCLPIPIPGLSVFFGLIIATLGISIASGWRPWLPQSWLDRPLPHATMEKICHSAQKVLLKTEHWIKPRFIWFHSMRMIQLFNGVAITVCALLLALPLPPGTNFPPSIAIICVAVGALETDGLLLILGYVLFILNVLAFGYMGFFGFEVLKKFMFH